MRPTALTMGLRALPSGAMEPRITEQDVAMLLLSEDALLALGAVLGLKAKAALGAVEPEEISLDTTLPA